jgi:hypothetical protein
VILRRSELETGSTCIKIERRTPILMQPGRYRRVRCLKIDKVVILRRSEPATGSTRIKIERRTRILMQPGLYRRVSCLKISQKS